jgi:hypothetical protein
MAGLHLDKTVNNNSPSRRIRIRHWQHLCKGAGWFQLLLIIRRMRRVPKHRRLYRHNTNTEVRKLQILGLLVCGPPPVSVSGVSERKALEETSKHSSYDTEDFPRANHLAGILPQCPFLSMCSGDALIQAVQSCPISVVLCADQLHSDVP